MNTPPLSMRLPAAGMLSMLLVAGCAALDQQSTAPTPSPAVSAIEDRHRGKGEFFLSAKTQKGFGHYLSTSQPFHFVVSTDGLEYASSACDDDSCTERALAATIDECERKAAGSCKLFARWREIVWIP